MIQIEDLGIQYAPVGNRLFGQVEVSIPQAKELIAALGMERKEKFEGLEGLEGMEFYYHESLSQFHTETNKYVVIIFNDKNDAVFSHERIR